jgi:hypothetical protein
MKQWMAWSFLLAASTVPTAEAAAPIYRCETPAGPVFSDHPCGERAELYVPDLDRVSIVATEPVPVAATKLPAARPKRAASRRGSEPGASRTDVCAGLNDSLRKIASTMRNGYGAKQGERLKERKRALDAKRRSQKC